jgi:hypothetical protein
MKFRAEVEPAERMKGLEVPPEVVDALGGGKRPPVIITVNGHSWKSRVAIMRGRFLLGLSNANRRGGGLVTGEEVEVELELDAEPRVTAEPADFTRALDADPAAAPPTTAWLTPTSDSTSWPSRPRRNPRRACAASSRPWRCSATRSARGPEPEADGIRYR